MATIITFDPTRPVFIRNRHYDITWKGRTYTWNQQIPWQDLYIPQDVVKMWFMTDKVYHNEALEAKHEVGDRLAEFDLKHLKVLVDRVNVHVKKRTNSAAEFKQFRIRKTVGLTNAAAQQQRGKIRTWLVNHKDWAKEAFYLERDKLLEEIKNKSFSDEPTEEVTEEVETDTE